MLKSKFRAVLQGILCFFLATLLASPTSALSNSTLEFFSLNGINFYNPSALNVNCFSSDISIAGSTAAEKIWSGLTTFLTPEQAAGVMGNMKSESNNLNPVQHEVAQHNAYPNIDLINDDGKAYGIGLIQWSWGRRTKLLKYIQSQDANLLQYFQNYDTYSYAYTINGDKFIELAGEAVFDRIVQLELEILKDELTNNSSYNGILNTTTVNEAAKFFLDWVERSTAAIQWIQRHDESWRERYENSLATRTSQAQEFYDALNGMSFSTSGFSGTNVTGSDITIIGDSITYRSKSAISDKLNGVYIDAETGRQFSTGITIARDLEASGDLRNIVVFALGTNSSSTTVNQIQEVIDIVGPTRTLYFITNYGVGYNFDSNNQRFKDAASNNSNVFVIDWAESVATNPEKYIDVHEGTPVHPTYNDGINLFANMIYNAVTSKNLTSDGCSVSGDFQATILSYAWPEYHAGKFIDMMPGYAAAVTRRRAEGKYVGGGNYPGIDCGGFVTAVMQDSGFSTGYNGYTAGTISQEKWVIDNGWTLLNSSESDPIDTSVLQPGDVAFSNGPPGSSAHTFVYVGTISGFGSNIASASYGGSDTNSRYWRAPMAGREDLVWSDSSMGGYAVRWYRKG